MTVFHRLNIAAIERDTPDAVAVTFSVPDALREQYHYRPGQHLTLKASIQGKIYAVVILFVAHPMKTH